MGYFQSFADLTTAGVKRIVALIIDFAVLAELGSDFVGFAIVDLFELEEVELV